MSLSIFPPIFSLIHDEIKELRDKRPTENSDNFNFSLPHRTGGAERGVVDAGQMAGGTGLELIHQRQQIPGRAVWEPGAEPWALLQPASASSVLDP